MSVVSALLHQVIICATFTRSRSIIRYSGYFCGDGGGLFIAVGWLPSVKNNYCSCNVICFVSDGDIHPLSYALSLLLHLASWDALHSPECWFHRFGDNWRAWLRYLCLWRNWILLCLCWASPSNQCLYVSRHPLYPRHKPSSTLSKCWKVCLELSFICYIHYTCDLVSHAHKFYLHTYAHTMSYSYYFEMRVSN